MFQSATKNIFDCAKLHFKIASGAGKTPAEGVAVQIRLQNDSVVIFQESNRHGNALLKICEDIQLVNTLSQKFTIEAIVFATELDTDTGNTLDPTEDSLQSLPVLINGQIDPLSIFIVEGHSADDLAIREYYPVF